MAASSSSSSSSSLGRLLQSTRIATWDPTIPQLYNAPPAFAARGQYGFKRTIPPPEPKVNPVTSRTPSLPSITRNRNIDLVCPDTPDGIAVWAIDAQHPRFLKTFQEKGVNLNTYDTSARASANSRARKPIATEPDTYFDTSSRRLLPSEVDPNDEQALERARSGLARPYGQSARKNPANIPILSNSGSILLYSGRSDRHPGYTTLDIVPNYSRMSDKQFEAYLQHIRTKVRPALVRHLAGQDRVAGPATAKASARARQAEDRKLAAQAEQAKRSGVETETADAHAEIAAARDPNTIPVQDSTPNFVVDMWDASRALASSYTTTFLRSQFASRAVQSDSMTLPASSGSLVPKGDTPELHINGGLQYDTPDEIYTSRLHRPPGLPGHLLHRVEEPRGSRQRRAMFSSSDTSNRGGAAVSVGSHVAHLPGPVLPPQLDHLDSVHEMAASDKNGAAQKAQPHLLVRAMTAHKADQPTAEKARYFPGSPVTPSPVGVSPTALLATSAAGRTIGSAREHVVLPDPTSVHVRVRPIYMDEVYSTDNRPLSANREARTPGTPANIAAPPERVGSGSQLPGVISVAGPGSFYGGVKFANRSRLTTSMVANSMRADAAGGRKEGGGSRNSLLAVLGQGSNRNRNADGDEESGLGKRLRRTSVGPSARPKHQSNIKK
ncbi:hypothetical protein OC846_003091 [Tilletia horrida]|uniref:Uncharacterized protein n=1 Tax=Tilletia horrida TaxID=155126 RepID=A0AAN6GSR7_9BASI|nr:hypothetical protein OC846_003091 [Tilletia horrida]KAK0568670.1 hypothetical protein OC861_001747 [Tilletia horrida]